MAGSEQRPTEDVKGHRYRNLDTEAIDEDQVADDTKGSRSLEEAQAACIASPG